LNWYGRVGSVEIGDERGSQVTDCIKVHRTLKLALVSFLIKLVNVMDWHLTQGGKAIPLVTSIHVTETELSLALVTCLKPKCKTT